MRFSCIVASAVTWSTVAALGSRGAAERAALYSIYLSEEIFTDTSKMSIATGCEGSRQGFRGQVKRCTLLEFIDHLWMETEGTALDAKKKPILVDDPDDPGKKIPKRAKDRKPDMSDVKFSNKVYDLGSTDAYKSSQAINTVKIPDPGRPHRTYTEFLNAPKVLNGYTDYYKTMSDVGSKSAAARAEFKKVQGSLEKKESKPISKWLDQADMALNYVYELRIKEDAQYKLKPPSTVPPLKSLSDCFGHEVQTKAHEYPNNLKDSTGKLIWDLKAYQEPDLDATVAKYSKEMGGDDAVRTKWSSAMEEYYKQPGGATHKAAIDAFAQSKEAIIPCP